MLISQDLLLKSVSKFNLNLSSDQIDKLDTLAKMLVDYNKKVNLTAITEADDIVVKHFSDSLAPLGFLDIKEGSRLADVGTGAGFPDLVLAIARPDLDILMIDSTKKKLDFIDTVIKALSLRGKTLHMRAEEAGRNKLFRQKFDLTTSRAVASLPVLAELCTPLLKTSGHFVALKGDLQKDEYESGSSALKQLGMTDIKKIDYSLYSNDKRSLITSKKISQTSTKYPRSFAQILNKPL